MSKFMLREKRDKEKNILNMYYVPNFICIFELNLNNKIKKYVLLYVEEEKE